MRPWEHEADKLESFGGRIRVVFSRSRNQDRKRNLRVLTPISGDFARHLPRRRWSLYSHAHIKLPSGMARGYCLGHITRSMLAILTQHRPHFPRKPGSKSEEKDRFIYAVAFSISLLLRSVLTLLPNARVFEYSINKLISRVPPSRSSSEQTCMVRISGTNPTVQQINCA